MTLFESAKHYVDEVPDAMPNYIITRQIAKEGEASGFVFPEEEDPTRFPEAAILGDGSVTESSLQRHSYGAAIGLVYPLEVRGHILRIKPSIAWYRYGLNIEGRVLEALKPDPPTVPPFGENIRLITMGAQENKIYDQIGPGLQFELDLGRQWQLRPTIYLDLYAYRLLTNRTTVLRDSVTIEDLLGGPDTYSARWLFQTNEWLFRGGAGVRVRWIGK